MGKSRSETSGVGRRSGEILISSRPPDVSAKKSEEGGGTKQKLGTNPSSSANPPPLLPRHKTPRYLVMQERIRKAEKTLGVGIGIKNGCIPMNMDDLECIYGQPPEPPTEQQPDIPWKERYPLLMELPDISQIPQRFLSPPPCTEPFDHVRAAILDFKHHRKRRRHEDLKKCATLAIAEYNSKAHTNYGFVDIKNVKWKLTGGLKWYITFRARRTPKDCHTFEAIVHTTKVHRQIGGIRIKRPGSTWYEGSLAELVKSPSIYAYQILKLLVHVLHL
ncbi:hypothetical protein P8452_77765 [Trifolium repens]|nr:hypothetical protein P8452_77765 [Trifolium repens]